jgi:pyocin large subunit-like protein
VIMPFDPLELADHFARHHADFAVSTDTDYEDMAERFLDAPRTPQLMECTRGNRDIVRYDTITTEYAVRTSTGIIRTYFKPVPCSSIPAGAPPVRCHKYLNNISYFRVTCTW